MNATVTLIKQPAEIETAWAQHAYRSDVVRRYWAAVDKQNWDEAGFIWLEAAAHDKVNPGSSPITAELDEQALADAA